MKKFLLLSMFALASTAGAIGFSRSSIAGPPKPPKRVLMCNECQCSFFWSYGGTHCEIIFPCIQYSEPQCFCAPHAPYDPPLCVVTAPGPMIDAWGFTGTQTCFDTADYGQECQSVDSNCWKRPGLGAPTSSTGTAHFVTAKTNCAS